MNGFERIQNTACKYYPCHENAPDGFNCMFCYCPLYPLGKACGGNFEILPSGIKDCSKCTFPHDPKNYDAVMQKCRLVVEIVRKANEGGKNNGSL